MSISRPINIKKNNYNFLIEKVKNINSYIDINLHKSIRCNVTGYINLKNEFEKEYVKDYFEQYSTLIQTKKQKKKNKIDIEAYLIEVKVPKELFSKENRSNKKYRKFIDQLKVELWEEDTPYIVFLDRRCKSTYLQFLICDRYYYPEGKTIQSKRVYYQDKLTGLFTSKQAFLEDTSDSIRLIKGKEKKIHISDKIRQSFIHYDPSREKKDRVLQNFIIFIKNKIINIKNKVLSNTPKEEILIKKETPKVLKKINNRRIKVNDKFKEFELLDSYQRRRIKTYNKVANLINYISNKNADFKNSFAEDYISLLKSIKDLRINKYEAKIEIIYNDLILFIGV